MFDFKGTTGKQATFLKTAMALEDTGVSAYAGAAPMIANKKTLAAALSVHSVEARHAAWVRDIIGHGGMPLPAPAPFDPARSKAAGAQDRHRHRLHHRLMTARAGRLRPARAPVQPLERALAARSSVSMSSAGRMGLLR